METESLLRKLGLNQYEIKAYLALLNSKPVTAYKLGKSSGVPSGRIYDIMDKLMLKGLVAQKSGKPKKFEAVEPEKALDSLLKKKDKKWRETKEKIEELIPQLNKEESEDPISLIKNRDVYYEKLIETQKEAEKEIRQIAGGLTREKRGFNISTPAKEALKRSVDIKILVPITEENKKEAERLSKLGLDVKDYPIHGLRVSIADNKLAHLAIVDDRLPYNRATITVRSKEFCEGLKKWFDVLWEKGEPIEEKDEEK